ncbi:uncharacterized protein LOC124635894 [Helicoverpa zea]|uniref:uncharacterized protein LOC124635894 n=1 Tax=Helicoverpa zea TaxID=7113 RepID=UPI001F58BFCE|nr:uncharacterized protein LOC124635894 [Helicoverpa zea]
MNIAQCENPEQYDWVYEVSRKKMNRTHDSFDFSLKLDRIFNSSYAVQIDVYQQVDGGFKYHNTIRNECACALFMKYAQQNMRRGLMQANVDPPDCPIQPGDITLKDFVMDYKELPKLGVYGTFQTNLYLLYEGIKYFCIQVILNFDLHDSDWF